MVSRRSLGDLTAFIGADASDLDRSLLQAERRFDQFTDGLEGNFDRPAASTDRFTDSLNNLGGAGSLVATALSGPGGVAAAIGGIGAAAVTGLNRLAQWNRELTLGAQIAGVTRQEYAALRDVFTGLGADGDIVQDVFNDINERLRDALEGVETYATAFDRLGISISGFASLDRVDRLFVLAQALEQVDADAAQLSANELAGDQGQRLLGVVRELGSEELISRYQAFLQAGTIGDESAAALQRYEFALQRIRAELTGGFFDELDRRVGQAAVSWSLLTNAAEGYGNVLTSLGILQQEQLSVIVEQTARYGDAAENYDVATDALNRYLDALGASVLVDEGRQSALSQELELLEEEIAALQEAEQALRLAAGQRRAAAAESLRNQQESRELIEDALDASARQATSDLGDLSETLAVLDDQIADFPDLDFEIPVEPLSRLEAAAVAALPAIENLFDNLIRGGRDAEDVLLSVVNLVLQLGLSNLSSGRGFFQFAGGFQFGGFIPPGQTGLVGERGPELITAGPQGATVTPEGAQIVNNVTVTTGDPAAIAAMFDELENRIYATLPQLQTTPGHPINVSTRIASA